MVIILAYAHDRAAAALAARWRAAGEDAAVLTCADLSRRGWLHVPNDPSRGRVAIDGRIVATQTIRAVIVRMPVVSEVELAHLHPGDRSYAASEMQAFLLSWLSSLLCSVINRPTTCNLGGPAWHTSEWVLRAARVGLAVRPLAWSSTATTPAVHEPRVTATTRFVDVLGSRAFLVGGRPPGEGDEPLAAAAIALARDAEVEMLRVYFETTADGTPLFVEAGMWIDLAADPIADAVTERCFGFVHGALCRSAVTSERTARA